MHWRAEVNKLQGINSSVITPDEVKKLAPSLDTSTNPRYPIQGALFHPPGGTIRHDAVVWGYARAADSMGVEMHQKTEVLDIICEGGEGPDGKGRGGKSPPVFEPAAGISPPRSLSTAPLVGRPSCRTWLAFDCRSRPARCRQR